jgi:hypothetical protein
MVQTSALDLQSVEHLVRWSSELVDKLEACDGLQEMVFVQLCEAKRTFGLFLG